MATIDRTLTTFNLPNDPTDAEVEKHPGTTSIDKELTTFPLPPRPSYHRWQLSVPIIFHTMGDDTPIIFRTRDDTLPVVFCSGGVRRYKYITVFVDTFALPTAPVESFSPIKGGVLTSTQQTNIISIPSDPTVDTEVS